MYTIVGINQNMWRSYVVSRIIHWKPHKHNIIQIHNNVLWDRQYWTWYSLHSYIQYECEEYFVEYCQSHKKMLWKWIMFMKVPWSWQGVYTHLKTPWGSIFNNMMVPDSTLLLSSKATPLFISSSKTWQLVYLKPTWFLVAQTSHNGLR